MSYLDYDQYYDTKTSRYYGNLKFGIVTGTIISLIGLADIIITLIDLFVTNYNQAANPEFIYTFDENPLWSTYGKGFWVGIIVSII